MKNWVEMATYIEKTYNTFVDWEEEFFICPECDEPIFSEDYNQFDSFESCCPICGFMWEE